MRTAASSYFFVPIGCLLLLAALVAVEPGARAQVFGELEIGAGKGGFTGVLSGGDRFGWAPENIGDLDDDGVVDLAVGANGDDDGGNARGAVWIVFLNADGTVKGQQKISALEGGFTGVLDDGDEFGHSVAPLGDFDGDGVEDIAVGALHDDDGGADRGAFYLLFLDTDGTVKSHQKVSELEGGFGGTLLDGDGFGHGITLLGDLDGDGVDDLAAATGHLSRDGTLWILFMNADGTVDAHQEITEGVGGFTGALDPGDELGHDLDALGDFDGDGVLDLLAGSPHDDDGGFDRGAFFLLFLNVDGTVKDHRKISDTVGGFTGVLDDDDLFGHPPKNAGDLDGDGVRDVIVGAPHDGDAAPFDGAFWILFLNAQGRVKGHQKVSTTTGGFTGELGSGLFAHIVSVLDDLDGDGFTDFAAGSPSGGSGSLWILFGDVASGGAPTAAFTTVPSGLVAAFTDASSDPDGAIVSWEWDFGDGESSFEANPFHEYPAAGTWFPMLTVIDDEGLEDANAQRISVPGGPCGNGIDDDGDGFVDFLGGDPGCSSPSDPDETDPSLECDNGIDDDGDGRVDFDPVTSADPLVGAGDPGCLAPHYFSESPQCNDGVDNDGALGTDFDGGVLAGANDPDGADPQCVDRPWRTREAAGRCGLGFEIVLLLAPLYGAWMRRGRLTRWP